MMWFSYLRISPSYALALASKTEAELAERLNDAERARAVWRTSRAFGDVTKTLYRRWWLKRGLRIFGIQSAKPAVEKVSRMRPNERKEEVIERTSVELDAYLDGVFDQQGRPDSVLISIPLGQKRTTTVRQLKKLLSQIEAEDPPKLPKPRFEVEPNKLRYHRLLAGLRLIFKRAAKPEEELWRAAARANISKRHIVDPQAQKKDAKSAEGRRMLTIMASRLSRDTLMIAENAALGRFPLLSRINIVPFDYAELGARIKAMSKMEKEQKAALLKAQAVNTELSSSSVP